MNDKWSPRGLSIAITVATRPLTRRAIKPASRALAKKTPSHLCRTPLSEITGPAFSRDDLGPSG